MRVPLIGKCYLCDFKRTVAWLDTEKLEVPTQKEDFNFKGFHAIKIHIGKMHKKD